MRKLPIALATITGIAIGGILFSATPTYADMPVVDAGTIAAVKAVKGVLDTINGYMQDVKNFLGANGPIASLLGDNKYGTVEQLLQDGFNQNANYQKASVGALEQITDASNTANARFARDMRNAQIRDQQTPSPTACTALDGGVSTQAAAVQAYDVGATIAQIHDLRGEAGPQMPSYYGEAEGVASINQEHINYYCDADDVAAGLCSTASSTPDADQQFSSLFGSGTYADQAAVNTAKDYAINLIEPVAPAALRADQLASTAGQYAAMRRRSYNARMSLAQSFVDEEIGMQTPSVPLTPLQQQYLTDIGLPAETNGSWLQVLQIEAERRVSDLTWASTLQAMPPASVEREIAIELAVNNYLEFQIFKTSLEHTTIAATALAQTVSHDFASTSRMPTPSMQASSN